MKSILVLTLTLVLAVSQFCSATVVAAEPNENRAADANLDDLLMRLKALEKYPVSESLDARLDLLYEMTTCGASSMEVLERLPRSDFYMSWPMSPFYIWCFSDLFNDIDQKSLKPLLKLFRTTRSDSLFVFKPGKRLELMEQIRDLHCSDLETRRTKYDLLMAISNQSGFAQDVRNRGYVLAYKVLKSAREEDAVWAKESFESALHSAFYALACKDSLGSLYGVSRNSLIADGIKYGIDVKSLKVEPARDDSSFQPNKQYLDLNDRLKHLSRSEKKEIERCAGKVAVLILKSTKSSYDKLGEIQNLAYWHMIEGEFDAAAAMIKKALAKGDFDSTSSGNGKRHLKRMFMNRLVQIEILRGNITGAEELLNSADKLISDSIEDKATSRWLHGKVSLNRKDYKQAELLLEGLPADFLFYRDSQLDLAYAYYNQSKFREAELTLLKGFKNRLFFVQPERLGPEPGTLLALCYCQTGHPTVADYTIERSLTGWGLSRHLAMRILNSFYNQARLQELLGRPVRALRYYEMARLQNLVAGNQNPALAKEIDSSRQKLEASMKAGQPLSR